MDGKICQNIKHPTHTNIPSSVQLSTWGRLDDQATNSFYTFCYILIVLKRFFVSKAKFNCFEKMSIFSYSLLPKILKLRRSSLKLVFLIEIVYNQFLLLKNFTSYVSYDLFPLIWNSLYLISRQSHKFPIGVEPVEIL